MIRPLALTIALLAVTLLAGSPAARAAPALPPSVTVDGQVLLLNGSGLRVFFLVVDGYRSGLYLRSPAHDAASVLAEGAPMEIRTVFLHAADASDLRGELNRIHDAYCARNLCSDADAAAYRTLLAHEEPVRAGDTEVIVIDGRGVLISRDGGPPLVIADAHFGTALVGSMLGPSAPTAGFRRGLLGVRG
jgi:hypothetical protein